MAELYSEFFEMLRLAKVLHDSAFSELFHDECDGLALDCDMCYELSYDAMAMAFAFTYEDYNEDYEFSIWVFGDPCIDKFCRLCREYESRRGLSEEENPYRREIEAVIREGFRFPGYSYDFSWYLSAKDRGRKRLVLFTGMDFSGHVSVPEGLLEIREGFDALNLRLEKKLSDMGQILPLPVLDAEAKRKEAA